jgi:TolA-binding protein
MGFGDTAKKLQKVASLAEDSYQRMNELREQLVQLRNEVESTSQQVDRMEHDLSEQRALLEALAEKQDIDVEAVIADANIEDVDVEDDSASDEGESAEPAADSEA